MALMARRPRLMKFNTNQIISRTRRAKIEALETVANEMEFALKETIDTPYPPASSPGHPPHKRTGYLQATTEVMRRGNGVHIRLPQYGTWLEGGTSKMDPRPFVRPNIHDQRRFWVNRINDVIRQQVGEAPKFTRRRLRRIR